MFYFFYAFIAGLAIIAVAAVIFKPTLFWPLLAVAAVGTGGIVVASMGLIDEIFIAATVVGFFLAVMLRNQSLSVTHRNIWSQWHIIFFLAMIFYMVFESLRGVSDLGSIRKIRWVLYFLMLGVIGFLAYKKIPPALSRRRLSTLIASTGLVYFAIYVSVGVFFETVLGRVKWDIQNFVWGGTTYAAFPIIAVMPAIFFLFKDKNRLLRILAWSTFIMVSIAAFYYDSRISFLAIIGFLVMLILLMGFRKFIRPAIIFIIIAAIFIGIFGSFSHSFKIYGKVIYEASEFAWNPAHARDIDRLAHLTIGPRLIKDDIRTFFFGYGFRTSGHMIGPALAQVYEERGMHKAALAISNYGSTVGFTALLVETGIIGMGLLIINFIFTAREIIFLRHSGMKLVLLYCLALGFAWMLITNPIDIALLYLIIMPSGFFYQLAAPDKLAKTIKLS